MKCWFRRLDEEDWIKGEVWSDEGRVSFYSKEDGTERLEIRLWSPIVNFNSGRLSDFYVNGFERLPNVAHERVGYLFVSVEVKVQKPKELKS